MDAGEGNCRLVVRFHTVIVVDFGDEDADTVADVEVFAGDLFALGEDDDAGAGIDVNVAGDFVALDDEGGRRKGLHATVVVEGVLFAVGHCGGILRKRVIDGVLHRTVMDLLGFNDFGCSGIGLLQLITGINTHVSHPLKRYGRVGRPRRRECRI